MSLISPILFFLIITDCMINSITFSNSVYNKKRHPNGCLFCLKCIDNHDTVSNSFIWFHSKNETMKWEVKLSFGTETMLISLSNWILSNWCLLNNTIYFFRPIPYIFTIVINIDNSVHQTVGYMWFKNCL